jgi:hypothetical protein
VGGGIGHGGAANGGIGHGHGLGQAGDGPAAAIANSNGHLSPNRSTGLARAQTRMSAQGLENTNNPLSPHRATGRARASARHELPDAKAVHRATEDAHRAIAEKLGRE